VVKDKEVEINLQGKRRRIDINWFLDKGYCKAFAKEAIIYIDETNGEYNPVVMTDMARQHIQGTGCRQCLFANEYIEGVIRFLSKHYPKTDKLKRWMQGEPVENEVDARRYATEYLQPLIAKYPDAWKKTAAHLKRRGLIK